MNLTQFIFVFLSGFITGVLSLMALRVILFRLNNMAEKVKDEQ
jgi:hypothetical protein